MASDWEVVSSSNSDWQQTSAQPTTQPQGLSAQVMSPLEKTGIFNTPVLGGVLRGIVQPATQMAEQGQQEQGNFSGPILGLNMPTGTKTMFGMNPQNQSDPLSRVLTTLGPQVATAGNAAFLMNPAGIVKDAASVPSYLTKGGVGKLISGTAEKATTEGRNITGDSLVQAIKDSVGKKFLNTPEIQKIVNDITSSVPGQGSKTVLKTIGDQPYTTEVPSKISPNELLGLRQQISKTYGGKTFFESPEAKLARSVSKEAYGAVTGKLKELVPEIQKPDKFYSFYSKKIGPIEIGSPAKNAARLIAYGALRALGVDPLAMFKKGAALLGE